MRPPKSHPAPYEGRWVPPGGRSTPGSALTRIGPGAGRPCGPRRRAGDARAVGAAGPQRFVASPRDGNHWDEVVDDPHKRRQAIDAPHEHRMDQRRPRRGRRVSPTIPIGRDLRRHRRSGPQRGSPPRRYPTDGLRRIPSLAPSSIVRHDRASRQVKREIQRLRRPCSRDRGHAIAFRGSAFAHGPVRTQRANPHRKRPG